ncbi:transcriptional repressor [Shimia litoralis]|uniref:Transcriptional repressor n=1 Tax=Shimia litoralis TaxID=420403 RepID=A0A4U7N7U7_9RHOB|nr:transcriptional repressor [Shimia litoralis]TKZ21980.1 transcriptional repressor [Shimia litoralis]
MHDLGFENHNHTACVSSTLAVAEKHCRDNKLQFTKVRRRVLEILLQEHRAMGAYDVLTILSEEGLGSQPPVIYRALDFLGTQGFIHKIEKLNAYVACTHAGSAHSPTFMICRACGAVVEARTPIDALTQTAQELGFQIETTVVEVEGLCPNCQESRAA